MASVVIVCAFWCVMKYDANTLKDTIGTISIAFLASEAAATFAVNKT